MLSQEWYYSKVLQLGKDALIPPTHRHREWFHFIFEKIWALLGLLAQM
jgi:hypothetical protein